MKRDEIEIGGVYGILVSGRVQPVRIVREHGKVKKWVGFAGTSKYKDAFGGWVGKNENSGREIRVHSSAKCRYLMAHSSARVGTGSVPIWLTRFLRT